MQKLGKNFLVLAGMTLLLWGCAVRKTPIPAAPATETIPVSVASPTPTDTVGAFLTPSATPLPIPSLEPFLKTNGPYLAYLHGNWQEKQQLVLMDADGTGKKVISMPSENRVELSFLSPDAKWLAYYLGSADNDRASDLSLHLLNLENGESRLVSKLLSSDYPNNFAQAAKEMNDPSVNEGALKWAFLAGITRSVAWSPDGQSLAFGGQMDGLSSDIYLYTLANKTIRRVTRGPEEIQEIGWSPDGKWLVSSSATWVGEGGSYTEDAIVLPEFTMKSLPPHSGGYRNWYSDHAYLINDSQNGIGSYNLRSVDIKTGKTAQVWDGGFHNIIFDPEKELLVLFPITRTYPLEQGVVENLASMYLLNLQNRNEIALEKIQPSVSLFGLGDRRFFTKQEDTAYFIASDGTLVPASPELDNVSVAPDKQHWISIAKTLKVFRADDTLVFELALPFSPTPSSGFFSSENSDLRIRWIPDSSGLFILINQQQIYRLDLHRKEIRLVETDFTAYQDWIFTAIGEK